MAASTAIGSGSIILTANADALESGLDQAAAKVDVFGRKAQATADRITKGRLGGLGAETSNKLLEASRAIIPSTLTAIATGAATAMATALSKMEEFNKALERTAELSEKSVAQFAKVGAAPLALAEKFSDPEHQMEVLRDGLKRQEQALHALEKEKAKAAERARGVGLFDNSMAASQNVRLLAQIPILGIGAKAKLDEAAAQLAEVTKRHDAAAESIKNIKDKMESVSANGRGLAQMEADRKAWEGKVKAVEDATRAMERQAATAGMTAGQIAVWDAEMAGVSGEQMTRLKAAAAEADRVAARSENVRKAFREMFPNRDPAEAVKLGGALQAGSAEAFRAVVRHQTSGLTEAGDTGKNMLDAVRQGNRLTEKLIDTIKDKLNFDTI